MCTRYSLTSPHEAVRLYFRLGHLDEFPARFNIAPTDPALIIRLGLRGEREAILVRWGFIPGWVKDPASVSLMVNARAETAAEKPSFRAALRHRRCLVPTSGFYEWTGNKGARQPHLVRLKTGEPFGMAGLWETWLGADGSEIDTMAILTTSANGDMARIHDRMPVIIDPADHDRWLDCRSGSSVDTGDLLRSLPDGLLEIVAVNPKLNNPRLEGPELHQPPNATLL